MPQGARLAAEGQEWLPGRDYEIVGPPLGGGEGAMSVVFRIRLNPPRAGEYALKMVCPSCSTPFNNLHCHFAVQFRGYTWWRWRVRQLCMPPQLQPCSSCSSCSFFLIPLRTLYPPLAL